MEERAPYARRDALISQIQGQSRVGAGGLEAGDSLRKAPILGSAASRAVILINHHKWRSNILICLPQLSPCIIPPIIVLPSHWVSWSRRGSVMVSTLNAYENQDALCSVLNEKSSRT